MHGDLSTDWLCFDYAEPSTAAELLGLMKGRTADVSASFEPVVAAKAGFLRRRSGSPYGITIAPYTHDVHPHWLAYFAFRKGQPFLQRVGDLPDAARLDEGGEFDASVRFPLDVDPYDLATVVLELLRRCAAADGAEEHLTGQWRAMIADTRGPSL